MNLKKKSLFFLPIIFFGFIFFSSVNYSNCMDATKHKYISQKGANHIADQCKAFIKDKAMVK